MALNFLKDATNAILIGPNGVDESSLARNIAHQALVHGHILLFDQAGLHGAMLKTPSNIDSALRRASSLAGPRLLVSPRKISLLFQSHAELCSALQPRVQILQTIFTINCCYA